MFGQVFFISFVTLEELQAVFLLKGPTTCHQAGWYLNQSCSMIGVDKSVAQIFYL